MLGTAAGGGFPQWNCACRNCQLARAGVLPGRWQSSLAVSGNGRDWHLVNASPDVGHQLERFVRPRLEIATGERGSPVRSVFLTNADLDHTLGLFQLRESGPCVVTAPPAVRASLEHGLELRRVLGAYGGIEWREPSGEWTSVDGSGLEVRAVNLSGGDPPRYDACAASGVHAVGYLFRTGDRTAGFFPDVARLDTPLLATIEECEHVWFDGTFWSEDEMLPFSGRTAAAMGHVPMGGATGSLQALRALDAGCLHYLHINNTNPVLRPDSAERLEVEAAGARIAGDGEHFVV